MMIYKRAEVARGRSFGDHPLRVALAPAWQVLLVVALLSVGAGQVTGDGGSSASPSEAFHTLRFEHSVYNVSIPENSVGKTYATQPANEDRLGVQVVPGLDVKYRIIAGDKDKLFKAEERIVGDFAFLVIRTRTNNVVLNREKGDNYKLEVRATGTRAEGKNKIQMETDVTVRVKVLDTNDLSPLFYPTEYSVSMPEDTPLHKSIIKVVAEDADLGVNGEIYYSIADDQEQFAIHPTTGVITLTRPLKSTDRTVYDLNVIANDRGSVASNKISQASRAKVQIRVKQVNLYAPDIYVQALPDILENSNANIYGIVRVEDKDKGVHGQIKSLEIVDGDPDGHFRIKPTSRLGEYNIEVHRLLDREQSPLGYNLTLCATDSGVPPRLSYKTVAVHLADINDNAPVFNKEIYEITVPETSPPNTPVIRLKVTDRDEGKNAQVFIEIVGGNEGGEFRINAETGMLYTVSPLDAETKAFYTLTVSAIDQGNAGTRKQSSAKVKINVQDTNDNDPIFENPNITIWIDENEPAGTTVTKVTARDKDSGENAYISYSIANLNDVPFDIDHFSGVIRTSKLLDYESMKREYTLKVRASDWGLPYRRQTEMQLTIKIRDVNDNRPQFEKSDCVGHIPRTTAIGTEILTLSAIDYDAGNIISYRMVSGNEDSCFNLDSVTGVLSVGCDLNDLRTDQREINMTATDGTHFADTTRIQVSLTNGRRPYASVMSHPDDMGQFECRDNGVARRLTELLAASERNNMPSGKETTSSDDFAMMPSRYGENIHAPEFIDLPLEVRVNESVPLGTTITWIRARDRDLGYNGKLVYGISGGDNDSVFRIDPETGELKIIGYLDREREDEYLLNITVYDLGKPQKSASKVLPITVLDENDNAPKFEKSLASFRVTENAINGTIIFRLKATDADLGENAKIRFSMITDTKDFRIDSETGVLSVSAPLDRERKASYELKIRASDCGTSSQTPTTVNDVTVLSSEALVRVLIDDINDNVPVFNLVDHVFRVREDVPKNTVIGIVSATDLDTSPGGEIQYGFGENGDGEGNFKIDKQSGTIRTKNHLDYEERQIFSLIVKAVDKGSPSLSSETSVIVEIIDVNENRFAPQFEDFVLQGSVLENQLPGAHVMTIKARDQDPPGPDSRVTYSIRGGDGLGIFTIDRDGAIRTMETLDLETKPQYWLTVCAQDQAVVSLYSCAQILIKVNNENDNVPLTEQAVYYASVPEASPADVQILQMAAVDKDIDELQQISYRIISGNPEGYFSLNSTSGVIATTARKLDRENQAEHILEVLVMDNGLPQLSSTTRIVITVEDINDHSPEFDQKLYKVQIPANAKIDQALFQKDYGSPIDKLDYLNVKFRSDTDYGSESLATTWETYSELDVGSLQPILRVLAIDRDQNENGRVTYSIKQGRGKAKFRIHPDTGVVYAAKVFERDAEYDLVVRAEDNGTPKRSQTARISVVVVNVPDESAFPPQIKIPNQHVEVTESDSPGFLVALIQATDEDDNQLWYDIVGGDDRNEFYIGRDNGNVLLAKYLDWETQKEYNLTISISDGGHTIFSQLYVTVIDINDNRPEFVQPLYHITILENIREGTELLQLQANDLDEDKKLFYSLHAARDPMSLKLFKVDSVSGSVTLARVLDREQMMEHVLIVTVKDQGTPAKRNYARVVITVHDHNDHAPEFTSRLVQGKVYETAPAGSNVVQVYAIDRDTGDNARLEYSIISGNIGNAFAINPKMGIISLAKILDVTSLSEYMLQVKATDHGDPALASQIPVHIMVSMADNSVPKFMEQDPAAEIFENVSIGTFVKSIEARASSSLLFEIVDGNQDDLFIINPSAGVITTKDQLDYETCKFYNLTIRATNMASASALCTVLVHVLDRNDNAPYFEQDVYKGEVSESAAIGSLVFTLNMDTSSLSPNASAPLVIKARDADSGPNAILNYDIIEVLPRKFFHIDSNTGAIKTIMYLDHEKIPFFTFHVKVTDLGNPRLSSESLAVVEIRVNDVNDCAPQFSQPEYNITLLLPTYANVVLLRVNATDQDSVANTKLRYDIIDGNKDGVFAIDARTGVITTQDVEEISSTYKLHIRVSDGKFSKIAYVNVNVEYSENSGLIFQKPLYEGSIMENSTKVLTVTVVNVLGSALNEHVEFRILNPTDMFKIGLTSGAIETTGIRFDRETKDNYELIIEARSQLPDREKPRVAHVVVNVSIHDINDNCPMFVNLPYYAVVSVDDPKGSVITRVHAVDLDSYENGEVRYEMKRGHGELFKVDRRTGEVSLKQTLEGHNRDYELLVAAYDGGITPCSTDVTVHVKVIDKSMPVFSKQFYSDTVLENIELHSPLSVAIQAESPLGRKLIYGIIKGNELEQFAVDFNTGAIYVVDELDYEQKQNYELVLRATDSISGVSADVPVSVQVKDVNDCPPEIELDSYNITVSESKAFGTQILKVVAKDNDTGINQIITYSLKTDGKNTSEYFHIDANEGIVYLKKSLDHETLNAHHFTVMATDKGVPSLSSTAHVWVTVLDMNDNPPKFEQPSYSAFLSEHAIRGQFVTIVTASDPDQSDCENLVYTIVQGNEQQTYNIDPVTGIITLVNMQNFAENHLTMLNVSVTDGVYTSFTRVKIIIIPANLHNPTFEQLMYDMKVQENQLAGRLVGTVNATDKDFGDVGKLNYVIYSDEMQEYFSIDKDKGVIVTKKQLDRELKKAYDVFVMASDVGGRSGFTTVRVNVGDENDNPPVFQLLEYKAAIHSNITINTTFLKIKATDADDNQNAAVKYKIYDAQNTGVTDLFAVNENTGGLVVLKSASQFENQMFQFFVRAYDGGIPSMHADVPVDVYIMASSDSPPVFEKKEKVLFLSENSPIGTIITRMKLINENMTASFRLISGDPDDPQFSIAPTTGEIRLAKVLDRETKDLHLIAVLAETDSSPPLTAVTDIELHVQDENDNIPAFESNPYYISLAENVEKGTSILKVTARDADSGSNGDVRYTFSTDNADILNVFDIDTYTGWVTTLVPLDKETKGDYKFQVIGTDNGTPKHSTRTTVVIKLKDYNDSPPVFKEPSYAATIGEDALPGTVVTQISVTDADVELNNTAIEFYIVFGNVYSQFQIRSSTGELFVAKPLDREQIDKYKLGVLVTDGKFVATTNITVTVLDANDNPPYCRKYRYREQLNEATAVGTHVLQVEATDIDDPTCSTYLRFYLTGDGSDHFSLDKDSGHLKTAQKLDRESQSKYKLVAHVQDRDHPGWECSSEILISLSDTNDNAPEFSQNPYTVTLSEDAEVGTLVTKIHATDADVGTNRKIKYNFTDSHRGHFLIASNTGIVTLAKPLDREEKATYNLTVEAVDQGIPLPLSTRVQLIINVQDINDNPPEFTSKHYFASIAESSITGTEIVRVLATSKDTGINAEIFYSIIGGNEHKKFTIDQRTGILSLAELLDYERAKDYFLTVQAIDGGEPPLSNLATVNISVTDSNDNAPVFSQRNYNARLREDAEVGDKIIQVRATDLDADQNGMISYSIEKGDRLAQFAIEEFSGYISVASALDRESVSNYVLEIRAVDHGHPQMEGFVNVNIEVSDANDNPPIFSETNYTLVVQEDKPIGHTLLKFDVSDLDTTPNAAPYTFDFRAGNDGGLFRIEQDGVLRTATRFNHKIKDTYTLKIRVFDNGTPPLYSDAWVKVKVIEESQFPPVITPLEISINSYQDEYPGGRIGRVYGSDQDEYDTLQYQLAPTTGVLSTPTNLFNISAHDGTLYAFPRLDYGDYRLNVTCTDGKFTTFAIIKIAVDIITDEMLKNAVIMRFIKVSPDEFILSHRKGFIRSVRNAIGSRLKDIIIISVQKVNDDDTEDDSDLTNMLQQRKARYRRQTEDGSGNGDDESTKQRRSVRQDLDVLFTVRRPPVQHQPNEATGFYSAEEIRKAVEDNLEEIEDTTKLRVDEVGRSKCTSSSHCVYGNCVDKIVLNTKRVTAISTDVTSFVSAKHVHKIECDCKEGYGGDTCQHAINECSKTPCPTYKVCVPDSSSQGFHCACPEGLAGPNCDKDITKCLDDMCYVPKNPVSFKGKSYGHYVIEPTLIRKALKDQLMLSLRIKTVQPTGNIMYAGGKVDYNILELVNGAIQYRFDLGSGEGMVSVTSIFAADGQWHEIKLEREGNSARLVVDGKHIASGSAPGVNGVLNLQTDDIYFGAEVRPHIEIIGYENVERGYIGCMDDIRISKVPIPLAAGASSVAIFKRLANVEFGCDHTNVLVPLGVCGTQPCFNGGTCEDIGNGNFNCQCDDVRFSGPVCKDDLDPCASSPCLYGGKCRAVVNGTYSCECPPRMTGKRCDYGRFCLPNPCLNGGICEEGDDGPLCMCRGYMGPTCEVDVDECEKQPCGNGATCINEAGSFRCICPPNVTGASCGDPLYSNSIISKLHNLSPDVWAYIIGGVAFLVILVLMMILCCCWCHKKKSRRHPKNNLITDPRKEILLKPMSSDNSQYKRGSKMSNLEAVQRGVDAQRPVSYTPSSNNETSPYVYNQLMQYNNLDTLRSYGSAGDELENVPAEYRKSNRSNGQQQININTGGSGANHSSSTTDSDSLHKQKWGEPLHVQMVDNKINNDLKRLSPLPDTGRAMCKSSGILPGRLNPPVYGPPGNIGGYEDSPINHGAYHWDCSDWAGRSHNPLPNITEVPGSEIPDSSSFHSNESNESNTKNHNLPPLIGPVDPARDIETLNEDIESEYVDDSECDQSEKPLSLGLGQSISIQNLNPLDSGSEDYRFNTVPLKVNTQPDSYLRHPNSYLPKYNIQSETDGEGMPLTSSVRRHNLNGLEIGGPHQLVESDEDDIPSYGFPAQQKRNRNRREASDIDMLLNNGGENSSLLARSSAQNSGSNSDLSTHLCEIEDSEFEDNHNSSFNNKQQQQPHHHHHHSPQPHTQSQNHNNHHHQHHQHHQHHHHAGHSHGPGSTNNSSSNSKNSSLSSIKNSLANNKKTNSNSAHQTDV